METPWGATSEDPQFLELKKENSSTSIPPLVWFVFSPYSPRPLNQYDNLQ